jgi:flagellar hook-associated protein 2
MAVSSTNSAGASGASIDVVAVVQQLMTVESRPLDVINAKITRQSTIISDLGSLKSKVSTFNDALLAFENPNSYNDTAVSTSNSSYVQATSANGTQLGNYEVSVSSIASPSRYAFVGFSASSTAVSNLTGFSIAVGSGETYTASDISEDIGATPTISRLAEWINALGENVAANVVLQNTDSNGDQAWALTIEATESGEENAVVLGSTTGIASANNTIHELAKNAVFKFNGIDFIRSSNTVSDVVDGLTLDLIDVTETTESGTITFAATAGNVSQFTLNGLTLSTTSANTLTATQVAALFANGSPASGTGYILTGTAGDWTLSDSAANGTAIFSAGSSGVVAALSASDTAPELSSVAISGFVDGDGDTTAGVQTATFSSTSGAAKRLTFNGLTLITDSSNTLNANGVASLFAGLASGASIATSGTGYILTGTVGDWLADNTATAGVLSFSYKDTSSNLSASSSTTPSMEANGVVSDVSIAGSAISPVKVRVKAGTDSSSTVIQTLVSSYNDLMAYYKTVTSYASTTNSDGSKGAPATFASNPTLLSFVSEIKSKFAQGASYGADYGSKFSLSWAGVDMQLDGTLKFDETNYDAAVGEGLLSILRKGVSVAYAEQGSLADYVDSYAGVNGYINDLILSKAQEAYALSDQQAQIQTRINKIEQNLYTQYSALNALLFQLSSTSDSLTSALDALNNNNN